MDLQARLARRARGKAPSAIRELLRFMRQGGMISLGGGYPNPDTFAFERIDVRFKSADDQTPLLATLEGADLNAAAQYGPSTAHPGLADSLRRWHAAKDGVELDVGSGGELVVLNGSQEGLFIIAYLLCDPTDAIALSEPAYPGALSAFKSFTDHFISVPIDERGMKTDVLADALQARVKNGQSPPKLIYTVPNGHNPGGVTLAPERRIHLLELATEHDLLIVEDDPYQLVRLDDGPPRPTLQALDRERFDGQRVVRLDSFSKIFAPGLRIGYASGPTDLLRQFELFKQSSNLHTSTLTQALLHAYLKSAGPDGLKAHIRKSCALYRANRDTMVEAAGVHLPSEVRFNVPAEGMFIWFELPAGCDAQRMIDEQCESLGVLLVPGPAFSACGGLRNCMRASFSLVSPDQIHEGMRRFGQMVRADRAG